VGTTQLNDETGIRQDKRQDGSFKRSAAGHGMPGGQFARLIAEEPGVAMQSLQQWKQQFRALPAGRGGQRA